MISLKDIGYIAGILEGEACFYIDCGSPAIEIAMTDKDVIEKVKAITKSNNIINKKVRKHSLGNKEVYRLVICGSLAIQWILIIYTLMSERRKKKILEIINRWAMCWKNKHDLRKGGVYLHSKTLSCLRCRKERDHNNYERNKLNKKPEVKIA